MNVIMKRSNPVDEANGSIQVYEVRPRKDHRGVDLISEAPPFGRLWYNTPDNTIGYAMHRSRSHDAVIQVYRDAWRLLSSACAHRKGLASAFADA